MSALTDRGSTHRWRQLREWWAQQLPLPCPRCGIVIQYGEPFDLDHQVPRAIGGDDSTARPAHAACNRGANSRRQKTGGEKSGPVFLAARAPEHPVSLSIFSRRSGDRRW